MARAKLYTTKTALKESRRIKSAKYYRKNREKILAQKQQERDEARRQEDLKFIERLREKRLNKWREEQKDLAREVSDQDPLGRIKFLNHSLARISGGKPSAWLETVCHQYIQIRAHEATRTSASPVDNATTMVNNLLRGANIFCDRLLNSYGVNDYYRRASMFCRRLRWIVRCLEDMEYRVLDLDDDLAKAYQEKRLSFQDPSTQQWIDRQSPIPE
ncbi:hypothetical protein VNI00_016189 [Paramarasmius palmivorus]|uniref:Uncharacterized protein n=1 Tax=Paramarasmius palmivorus TaxID=297713 RepID=A0AAW0BEF5_9AGAR